MVWFLLFIYGMGILICLRVIWITSYKLWACNQIKYFDTFRQMDALAELDRVSNREMMLKFWRPVSSFYDESRFKNVR